jgi:hypothetical protein
MVIDIFDFQKIMHSNVVFSKLLMLLLRDLVLLLKKISDTIYLLFTTLIMNLKKLYTRKI